MTVSRCCNKIFKFRALCLFLRYFKASISTHPEKYFVEKLNRSLISSNGDLKFKNLGPRASAVVYKCNVEIMNLGQHGKVREARKLFDEMPHRDVVSYNSMITVYLKNKDLPGAEMIFEAMPERSITAESAMVDGYVKAGRLDYARKVFDSMRERNPFSWTSLVSGYFNSGQIEEGQRLFAQMPAKNVVSWTTVILGYARNGLIDLARRFFELMPEKDTVVWTAMIKTYVGKGCFSDANELFHKMPQRNVYSWNIMISGYLSANRVKEAIQLFNLMPHRTHISWTTMVTGLARNKMINDARKYFDQMPNKDIVAWNAMITAYVDQGLMDEARKLFILMAEKNVVTWNAMIEGYTRGGNGSRALQHFVLMLRSCCRPNETTMTQIVTCCNGILELVQTHAQVTHLGFERDTWLTNALITMYSKSGDFFSARLAFERLKSKDAASWTAMIIAYSNHGHGHHALQVFARMLISGAKPDEATFAGLLTACSDTGLVNKGRRLFDSMRLAYNLKPRAEHFSCLVEMLGRAGLVNEAMGVIYTMSPSERDGAVLWALLGACKLLGDVMDENLSEIEASTSGGYGLLANAYAAEGLWDEFAQVRRKMRKRNVKKDPGYSKIEIKGKNHVFIVGDKSHPQVEEIYKLLQQNLQPLLGEMGCISENPLLLE